MSKNQFHVNPAGEPGPCSAEVSCPFGSNDEHFNTKEEARDFYEKQNAEKVLPQTMSKSELNKAVKDSADPEVLLHGAINGTDRTRGNLVKNPNATPESLVAVRDNSDDEDLKLRAQMHDKFPVGKMDDKVFEKIEELSAFKLPSPEYSIASNLSRKIYGSDELTDEIYDRATSKLGNHSKPLVAVLNTNNKLSTEKLISIAESDNSILNRVVKDNYKYPVADRIEHLSPDAVEDLAGSVKDPAAIRNIMKYPPYKSTRARTLLRVAMNSQSPIDALEGVAKEDTSPETSKALYKHPNATPRFKKTLTDRSDELKALGQIDLLRERSPEVMANFESSVKKVPDVNVSVHKYQFDPEVRKHTGLTDEQVEVYAKNTLYPNGKYDHETNTYTYTTEPGGRWTGD